MSAFVAYVIPMCLVSAAGLTPSRSLQARVTMPRRRSSPSPSIAVQRSSHGVVVATRRATISTTASRPKAILLTPAPSRPLAAVRAQASRMAVGVKGYRALTATIPSAIHSSWKAFLLAAASVSRLAMERRVPDRRSSSMA